MPDSQISNIEIQPGFELEDFMNFTHETRLSSEALKHFIDLWTEWLTKLKAVQIADGKNSWLAIWLPEEVEKEIDQAWDTSPTEGFLINGLAQYMCMAAVEELLPQAAGDGCAPAPTPHSQLTSALDALGLLDTKKGPLSLARKFAVLTYFPFKGSCEICAMQENCPKGANATASVTLPGYERGIDD